MHSPLRPERRARLRTWQAHAQALSRRAHSQRLYSVVGRPPIGAKRLITCDVVGSMDTGTELRGLVDGLQVTRGWVSGKGNVWAV
eukprot:363446-Chlamydomonas_euryale.AAC.9